MKPWRILEHARQTLESAVNEAGYRAAASRAYIATFQHILGFTRLRGFNPGKTGEDHRDLIDFLKGSDDALLRKVGISRLPRLRALRNHADYELDIPFTKELAQEALDQAEEIVQEWLPGENEE
jgi:uncharacterized protein (UPF0332 family)